MINYDDILSVIASLARRGFIAFERVDWHIHLINDTECQDCYFINASEIIELMEVSDASWSDH